MQNDSEQRRNTLRTGIFGIILVICLIITSYGYTTLPFWPQPNAYIAYFANAASIAPGDSVELSGYAVGSVTSLSLENGSAKVGFTVDRKYRLGDQTMVSITANSILGQKSLAIEPGGVGSVRSIPLTRTTTPYSLNTALQDLGRNTAELDKEQLNQALELLTDAMRDATPELRSALDGVGALSKSVNKRDAQIAQLLTDAHSITTVLAQRSGQLDRLINDGSELFAELDGRRQALGLLISGIAELSRQLSGFVDDNRQEFGPALARLNRVLANLNMHREHLSEALKQLPPFATTLGEVVGSAPGFTVNIYGVPPPAISATIFDSYFQPGALPDSLSDYLHGFINERIVVRPKSP